MAAAHRTHFTGISSGDLTGSLKRASLLETLIGPFGWRLFRPTGERTMNGKESPQITKTAYRPDVCTAVTEKKEKLTTKIVLTHTEEFPFDNYEQNLLDDSLYPAYFVKLVDEAMPRLLLCQESQQYEDCASLSDEDCLLEREDAECIEAWEPIDSYEIVSGEQYIPALTRPELLLLKTCLKRGGFNLPLEWRGMAKQLFERFDRELQGEIQLGTDGQKTN